MSIVLQYIPVMYCAGREGPLTERPPRPPGIDLVRWVVVDGHVGVVTDEAALCLLARARAGAIRRQLAESAGAEVRHLIHVDPQAVERDHVIEFLDLVLPVRKCRRVHEVREVDRAGPDLC